MLTCGLSALSALSIVWGVSGGDPHQRPRCPPVGPAHEASTPLWKKSIVCSFSLHFDSCEIWILHTLKQKKLTFKHKWQPHITVITTLQAGVKINICHLKKMEERKQVCVYKDAYGSVMLLGEMRDYLRLPSRLQLVFVVAEPFVIETYVFCQGADLL